MPLRCSIALAGLSCGVCGDGEKVSMRCRGNTHWHQGGARKPRGGACELAARAHRLESLATRRSRGCGLLMPSHDAALSRVIACVCAGHAPPTRNTTRIGTHNYTTCDCVFGLGPRSAQQAPKAQAAGELEQSPSRSPSSDTPLPSPSNHPSPIPNTTTQPLFHSAAPSIPAVPPTTVAGRCGAQRRRRGRRHYWDRRRRPSSWKSGGCGHTVR